MSTEICIRCLQEGTPWGKVKELDGHVCYDCYYELMEIKKNKEIFDAKIKEIEDNKKTE